MDQTFTDRQIEAHMYAKIIETMPPRIRAFPALIAEGFAQEALQQGMASPKVRNTIIGSLHIRALALKVSAGVDASTLNDPKAVKALQGFRDAQAKDDEYIKQKYNGDIGERPKAEQTSETPKEEQMNRVLDRGLELIRSMENGGNPSEEQMQGFVKDFLALPGQLDGLIQDFHDAQLALKTTEEALQRAQHELSIHREGDAAVLASREWEAALRKRREAEDRFLQAEFFLHETLDHAGDRVEGDPATRTLTGTKMGVRATKTGDGILYAILEKQG